MEKCRKQSDFALKKCKCYHIICRHQYTHVTNSILFVVCPFKIGFHPSENHLYFISVFIYTFIKVKLTKGRKRDSFAKTKPNQTYRHSLLAAKIWVTWVWRLTKIQLKAKRTPPPLSSHKNQPQNPWIHLWFCSPIRRNNHRYALSLRTGGFGAKESHFPLFPSVWRQTKVKSVKSSIFDEKTSKFSSSLSFRL